MTVQDPTTLRSEPTKGSMDGIVQAFRGLYTLVGGVLAFQATTITDTSGRSLVNVTEVVESKDATSQTTLDFTTGITSGLDYEFTISNLHSVGDDVALWIRISTDGGSTWISTSSYQYAGIYKVTTFAAAPMGSAGDTKIVLIVNGSSIGMGTNTGESADGVLTFNSPAGTDNYKRFHWKGDHNNAAGNLTTWDVGGSYQAVTAINGVQFLTSDGNGFASGTVTLRSKARS